MPRIRTWLTDRFDLDLPVVTASMAGVATGGFAAAASTAGVLGTIGVGSRATGAWIDAQVATAAATGRPFGIGLMAWAQPAAPEQLEAALRARPALVSVSFGDFAPYVRPLQAEGITVVTQVGSVEQARRAVDAGVDAVVARGGEAGGHGYNLVALLPLLQMVVESVDIPVLAAGGISTARGLAAVLAAGAAGAWVGTAFTCCQESGWADDQVAATAGATETSTAFGRVFDIASGVGWPEDTGGRAIQNAYFERWSGHEQELLDDAEALAQFRAAPEGRDFETMPVYVGQGVGLLDGSRPTVVQVVTQLSGAAELLTSAAARVEG